MPDIYEQAAQQVFDAPDAGAQPDAPVPEPAGTKGTAAPAPAAAAPAADPYEAAAQQIDNEQKRLKDLGAAQLEWAATHDNADPGTRAEVMSYTAITGQTPLMVQSNLPAVREFVKANATPTDWKVAMYRQPGLARMLQKNIALMPAVKDDSANLHGVEWALGSLDEGGLHAGAPVHALWDALNEQRIIARQFVAAEPGAAPIGFDEADNADAIEQLKAKYANKDYGNTGKLDTVTIATARMLPFILGDLTSRVLAGGIGALIGGGAAGTAGAATGPGDLAIAPAGAVAGGAVSQFFGSGLFNYYEALGPDYERFKEMKGADGEPLDPALAQAAAQSTAMMTGGLMAAGGGFLGKSFGFFTKPLFAKVFAGSMEQAMVRPGISALMKKGLTTFGKDWLMGATLMAAQSGLNATATEVGQYAADQGIKATDLAAPGAIQAFGAGAALNAHWGNVGTATTDGFVGGIRDMGLLSAIGAGREVIREVGQYRASANGAVQLDTLMTSAANSKLLERSPELFEKAVLEFKNNQGAVQNAYVPFEKWTEYWQSKKVDPGKMAAEVMGDDGKAFTEAAQTKGDLAIPIEKYTTKFAKTEHAAGLAADTKLHPEELTPNQTKDALETSKKQMEAEAKRRPEVEEGKAEVRKFIRDMSMKAGHERSEADGVAKLVADNVGTMALKLNVSIPEAATLGNLGGLRILGPKGEAIIRKTVEHFSQFLRPGAEKFLEQRVPSMSPEARAREVHIDRVSGLRNRSIFDAQPVPGGASGRPVSEAARAKAFIEGKGISLNLFRKGQREDIRLPASKRSGLTSLQESTALKQAASLYGFADVHAMLEEIDALGPDDARGGSKMVGIITSPSVKAINEHPTHGGHGITDEMLRAMGATIGETHPEAARDGTSFLVHVSSDAELRDLQTKVDKALGKQGLDFVGATGPDTEQAFGALDRETARRRGELKDEKGQPIQPTPEEKLPERGKLQPGVDVTKLKFPEGRARGTVPPEFVDQMRGINDEDYAKGAYADRVTVGGEDKPTGLLSRNGWDAIPRKAHAAMLDLRGLKDANNKFGKATGNDMLFMFGDLIAHHGGSSFDASHLSGDEFALQHDDPVELERFVKRLKAAADDLVFDAKRPGSSEWEPVTVDFRHGIGTDLILADRDLSTKKAREQEVGAASHKQEDGAGGVVAGENVRRERGDLAEAPQGQRPDARGARSEGQVGEGGNEGRASGLGVSGAAGADVGSDGTRGGGGDSRSGIGPDAVPDGGDSSDAGGVAGREEPPRRGATRFFQRQEVVSHVEGVPVVYGRRGSAADDASFDFGANALEKEAQAFIDKLPPEQRAAAEAFRDFAEGKIQDRPVIPPDLERALGKRGIVDPDGYPFDENGRDLRTELGGKRSKGPTRKTPDSLAEARHNRSGAWWTKYKQFPTPEQSLENMQAQRVFNELASEHGVTVVDSTKSLIDRLDQAAEGGPTWSFIGVASGHNETRYFRDYDAAREFIEESDPSDISGVFASTAKPTDLIDRKIESRLANDQQREALGFGARQPHVGISDIGEELQDVPGDALPPESKNLPGQLGAEAATAHGGLGHAVQVFKVDPGYTGTVKFKSEGRDGQGERGSISLQLDPTGRPREMAITAFTGDKSTLLHETAHFLSWSFHDIAESDLATPQLKGDYLALLKWAGFKSVNDRLFKAKQVEELAQKGELSRGEERKLRDLSAAEERISHGFEQYLFEGKAPNAGLARVFSKFRGWLMGIYSGLSGIQKQYSSNYGQELNLSDEVRDIFARLLGQDQALQQARRDIGDAVEGPRPPPIPTAGMTPAEREAYFAAREADRISGEREMAQRSAELEGEQVADVRAAFTRDVTKELDKQPVYRAERYLQHGELVDPEGNVVEIPDILLTDDGRTLKLDRKEFVKQFGKETAAVMPPGIWEAGGVKADELAPMLGFNDGAHMVDTFKANDFRDRAISKQVQDKVNEAYSPALGDMAKTAMSAVHNEHTALKTLLELRAAARQVDPAMAKRINAIDPKVMKANALRLIMEKGIGELDPDAYARAERNAALKGAELQGRGDHKGALEAKLGRLWNQMLYRAARDASDTAEKVQKHLENTSQAVRGNLGRAAPEYRDLHDAIIHAVGLGPEPHPQATGLDEFMAVADTNGHDPSEAFDPAVMRKVLEGKYDWEQLSVAEATNVSDAITYIRHIARETNEIETKGKRMTKLALQKEIADRAASVQKPQPRMPYSPTAEGFREGGRRLRRGAQTMLEDIETWAEMLDGGTSGPTHDLLIHDRIACRTKENGISARVLKPVKEAWEKIPKDIRKLKSRVEDVSGLLPVKSDTLAPIFTRDTLWRLFMAYGSEGNRQRLNDGNGWSNENIEKALSVLTEPELDFLQTVKDGINSLYPEMAAAYEKRTGLKLGKVDALPVTINGKTFAGGYDPIRYDARRSSQGKAQTVDDVKGLMGSSYQKPSLPTSFTKKRVEKVVAPLDLSWSAVPTHLSQVIRDISYGNWVRQVGSIMLAKESKETGAPPTFHDTTVKFLGEERAKEFVPWLSDVANARADSAAGHQSDFQRRIGAAVRSKISLMVMGLNLPSLTRHSFDPWSTLADSEFVAPHHIMGAYLKVVNPLNWKADALPEFKDSVELANIEARLHDNMREELGRIGPDSASEFSRIVTMVSFKAHELVHHFSSRVVFKAGYDQATANGGNHLEAVQRGDDLVRRHLPSGDLAEKPPILRSKQGWAQAVMFYGYASKMHNLRARAFDDLVRTWQSPNADVSTTALKIATVAGKWLALGAVASMGAYLSGRGWARKDDDAKGAGEWAAEELAFSAADDIPIIGPATKKLATGHQINIGSAPELAFLETMFTKLQRGIAKAKQSGHKRDSDAVWAGVEALMAAMGPSGFVEREFRDINMQRKGEFRPKGPVGQIEGAFYGPPKTDGTSSVNPLSHLQKAGLK